MRRVVVMMSLLVLSGFAVGLSMAGPDVAVPTEPAMPIETEEAVVPVCAAPDLFGTSLPFGPPFGPNYCGDPCDTPGQEVGCIDTSGPVWRRVICYCSGGYLTC